MTGLVVDLERNTQYFSFSIAFMEKYGNAAYLPEGKLPGGKVGRLEQ